jgi:hypothetical protein
MLRPMAQLQRVVFVGALAGGVIAGYLVFRSLRDPCGALLREYAQSYDAAKPCMADDQCVLDPLAAAGPGVCDRARNASSQRDALDAIEGAWVKARCPAPGKPCPPTSGVRCEKGRCVTLLAR